MNTFLFASVENLWLVAGWTMIHFLWFGTVVALAALLCRWLLRRASANVRYATSLACLVLFAALPIAVATWLHQNPPPSQVRDSPRRGEPRDGFVSTATQEPIANLTRASVINLSKQVPISTNVTPTTPAQITTHAEVIPSAAPTASPAPAPERDALSLAVSAISTAVDYLPWLWLIGTPITFALTATGLIGTRRLRRASRPITDGLIHESLQKLAASLRLTRHVAVAVCDRIAAPVLIGILRPIILLPPAALTGYSPDEIEMVLLHELAHVRRWDNLVNLIQRLVESLLFFHPAVWLISNWVRREREACCDALVVTRTDRPHAYAELLVALAAQMPRSVLFHPAASSAMAAGPLQSRIRRILKLDDDPMLVSGKSIAVLLASLLATATIVGLYLPTDGRAEPSKPESRQNDDHAESPAAEFSHQVKFEKGAAKFQDGDSISIDEIRGTAETFMPGNRYWIKGTYKLKSHDRAQISAFTTAARAEDGTGPIQSEQTKQINGGEAAFTLILPMSVRGWPHLSFYPADNGGDFGGIYFGTGDSVLKKWWGEAAESANESSKPSWSDADRERFHRFEKAIKDVEIVVALFNDKDGSFPALDETHKQLAQRERSLYTYGLKADPSSVEAKRFNLSSAPTCIVFRSGKEVARLTPVESAKRLQEFVTIAVNGGATDVAQLLPLFRLNEGERVGEKIYRLPAALEKVFPELPELIERLKKDPSRSQFAYNLKDSGRVVEVIAPAAAHKRFFEPRISQWEKRSKSDSNAEKQTTDNLKNLSLAIQNYHDTRKVLPANAIYDAKGKPLLSWRVQILPFLDEAKLYQEFHLNEPWDSEHNRKLIARMPDVFKNPKLDKQGMTNYLAVVGPECVFNGTPKALGFKHVTDGTSNTIALVEANPELAVEWTKPQDWNFDRAQPTRGLGQLWPGGWYAAWVDGSVRRIENSEPADRIGIQFTRAGGETTSLQESTKHTMTEGVGGAEAGPGEASSVPSTAASSDGRPLRKTGGANAATELLLRGIADLQQKKVEIESQLYQAQADYLVAKSRLEDPKLNESQKSTAKTEQLTKEYQIRSATLQTQLAALQRSLDENMKILKDRNSKSVDVETRAVKRDKAPSSKFPTLEEQRLADLAWKRLQLELEPLGPEDLKRTKALGYDGGVIVTSVSEVTYNSMEAGDILVGLHVWPTTNMKDVAQILNRDDLDQLAPLKFYVVRLQMSPKNNNDFQDAIVTGRISVKSPEKGPREILNKLLLNPADQQSPPKLRIYLFYSPDAEPSVKARTALKQVVKQFSDVKLNETDVSREPEKAKHLAIDKVPTYLLVRDGEVVRRVVGLQDEKELHKEISDALSANSPIDSSKASKFASPDKTQSTIAPSPAPTVGAYPIQPATPKLDTNAPVVTGIVPNTDYVKRSDGNAASIAVDPNSPAPAGGRNQVTLTPAESVFIAYDIPQDLKEKALGYFTKSDVRSMADDRGRYIIQATQNWHDRFAAMLTATPKWRDSSAAKERAAAPIVMKKTGDEDILEWRSVGLSFKRNTDSRNLPPTSARRDQSSVAVAEVVPGSPAAWADIRPGDVLTDVGSFNAGSMPEVQSLLKALGEGLQSKKGIRVRFYRRISRSGPITADFTLGPEDLGGKSAGLQSPKPSDGTKADPAPVDKAKVLYDGKTLDQWRRDWYVDADATQKLKVLYALEAFAEAGLDREANSAIEYGLYSNSLIVAQRTRQYLNTLSKSDAAPIVEDLLAVLKTDVSSDRRISALRGLASLGPNAESALPAIQASLAKKNPRERIAAATAIKKIVGKDQYQKPVADVLGKELGITVQNSGNGVWAALPRDDSVDDSAFNKFTEDVIKEQDSLFPPDDNKPPKSK